MRRIEMVSKLPFLRMLGKETYPVPYYNEMQALLVPVHPLNCLRNLFICLRVTLTTKTKEDNGFGKERPGS